ncbi:helix-turn-helix domain-containing protein [Ornithinibacillus massiliensis]|uniref:Helix-turn-helix domain-containing protein n=1 Tax=Ornithinibacillus massiliensis TaxID=1944633 RepID=A0ABS5MEI9_9BACI|nr:helix-turn-helix domain-containing protein [Ornithinibacillus massiliensis]MBS3680719.1 helix-turn-helix domain-containing protein [Ornithinibacillus massiliensis]
MKRRTLTVKEVANYLGVHTDTIYTMVKLKQIPHLKLRNRILFTKDSIDLWVQDQAKKSLENE